ncbi:hypothetical protein PCASD_20321 [Puccinia coronata f. sp. avenae]|uniref:Uncharacterized protein n=1 Tax=Puccinia coronata f. sp. avenae TaxID=200324 RepID=A0A2N5U339_9BASI|nr:hypothetical protein PCASD_20321 [Puccinia coronata f. sp. avenae]
MSCSNTPSLSLVVLCYCNQATEETSVCLVVKGLPLGSTHELLILHNWPHQRTTLPHHHHHHHVRNDCGRCRPTGHHHHQHLPPPSLRPLPCFPPLHRLPTCQPPLITRAHPPIHRRGGGGHPQMHKTHLCKPLWPPRHQQQPVDHLHLASAGQQLVQT